MKEIIEVFHDLAGFEFLLPDNSNRISLFPHDAIQSNYLIDGFEFQKFRSNMNKIWHINKIKFAKKL